MDTENQIQAIAIRDCSEQIKSRFKEFKICNSGCGVTFLREKQINALTFSATTSACHIGGRVAKQLATEMIGVTFFRLWPRSC